MFNFDKPRLGDISAITIATSDLEASFRFYSMLGFTETMRNDQPFPWIQMTDGALLIMLRYDTNPVISLTYYVRDMDTVVKGLLADGITFHIAPKETDLIKRYVFTSPDGLKIGLVTDVGYFKQPPGPTMLTMQPQNFMDPTKYTNPVCGMFGEFAHPVKDLDASIAFWEKMGYKTLSKENHGYPWAIVSDGLGIIGLHQTTDFNYPAITFFAADMRQKIASLKEQGLNNYTERGGPANIVVETPEKQHLFLFSMGM